MSKTKTTARRAADLRARFARIKASVLVTDQLLEAYFETRATEIEAFHAELLPLVTQEADEQPVN